MQKGNCAKKLNEYPVQCCAKCICRQKKMYVQHDKRMLEWQTKIPIDTEATSFQT